MALAAYDSYVKDDKAPPLAVLSQAMKIDPSFAPLRGNPRFERLASGE